MDSWLGILYVLNNKKKIPLRINEEILILI